MARKRHHKMCRHYGLQTLEVVRDAFKGHVQRVQLVVDPLSTLLAEKTQTNAKPPHTRNKVVFQQVKLRGHVPPLSLDDFSSSCRHEHLYMIFKKRKHMCREHEQVSTLQCFLKRHKKWQILTCRHKKQP